MSFVILTTQLRGELTIGPNQIVSAHNLASRTKATTKLKPLAKIGAVLLGSVTYRFMSVVNAGVNNGNGSSSAPNPLGVQPVDTSPLMHGVVVPGVGREGRY